MNKPKQNLYIVSYRSAREIDGISTFTRNLAPIASDFFNKIFDVHISSSPERILFPKSKYLKSIHLGSNKDNANNFFERRRVFKRLNSFFSDHIISGDTILFNSPAYILACPMQTLDTNTIFIAQHRSIDKYKKDLRSYNNRLTPLVNKYVSFFPVTSMDMKMALKEKYKFKTNVIPVSLPPSHLGEAFYDIDQPIPLNKVTYLGRINKREKHIVELLKIFTLIPHVKFNIYGKFEKKGFEQLVKHYQNKYTNIQYGGQRTNPYKIYQQHSAAIIADPDEPSGYGVVEAFSHSVPIINFSNNGFARKPTRLNCGIHVDYDNLENTAQQIAKFVGDTQKLKAAKASTRDYYNQNMQYDEVYRRWKFMFNIQLVLTADE